jgi:hypothetical protein
MDKPPGTGPRGPRLPAGRVGPSRAAPSFDVGASLSDGRGPRTDSRPWPDRRPVKPLFRIGDLSTNGSRSTRSSAMHPVMTGAPARSRLQPCLTARSGKIVDRMSAMLTRERSPFALTCRIGTGSFVRACPGPPGCRLGTKARFGRSSRCRAARADRWCVFIPDTRSRWPVGRAGSRREVEILFGVRMVNPVVTARFS